MAPMPKVFRDYVDANGCRWQEVQGAFGRVTVYVGKGGR